MCCVSCATQPRNKSRDIPNGLALIQQRGDLGDAAFTARALDLDFVRDEKGLIRLSDAARADFVKSNGVGLFVYQPDLGTNARLLFKINPDVRCITPNELQTALGNLHSDPIIDIFDRNVGLNLVPDQEESKLRISLEMGSGCLTQVDIQESR
jgi:hypothetical protein